MKYKKKNTFPNVSRNCALLNKYYNFLKRAKVKLLKGPLNHLWSFFYISSKRPHRVPNAVKINNAKRGRATSPGHLTNSKKQFLLSGPSSNPQRSKWRQHSRLLVIHKKNLFVFSQVRALSTLPPRTERRGTQPGGETSQWTERSKGKSETIEDLFLIIKRM